ncbi:hypothetical protein [Propionimicrobium sp. PCR01-08-3]|uniref:hypothetical protein n=1 Tax=Propionimicrobium sp. PCR01-08-3 TaxID=3052086 RepID=UPI00255C2CA9|nr:hypothetical protein [Propionimicrobium sp. PCR01-08-3]WIY82273.1 hypothetical protein QQ658_12320 [Propionimicrobium sp. PCR01-08-3]
MIPSRTDDLRFADWLDSSVPDGFDAYRKIVHDGDDLSTTALAELIALLRCVTPPHLQQEVSYGLWEGHSGIFGGGITADGYLRPTSGLARAVNAAAQFGSQITAFRDRRRADTASWIDTQLHSRLELSARRYLLFRGRLEPVVQWFRDTGPVAFRRCPDLIWPDDHSWIVTAPPEQGFTVVAGARELIDLLDSDPMFETN